MNFNAHTKKNKKEKTQEIIKTPNKKNNKRNKVKRKEKDKNSHRPFRMCNGSLIEGQELFEGELVHRMNFPHVLGCIKTDSCPLCYDAETFPSLEDGVFTGMYSGLAGKQNKKRRKKSSIY